MSLEDLQGTAEYKMEYLNTVVYPAARHRMRLAWEQGEGAPMPGPWPQRLVRWLHLGRWWRLGRARRRSNRLWRAVRKRPSQ